MSFSSEIKDELLKITELKPCCSLAEMYGLMLFAKNFSKREMYLNTENEAVAQRYKTVAERLSLENADFIKSPKGKCKVEVRNEKGRLKVLEAFGLTGNERSRKINWANIDIECDRCPAAFLRGVFLSCGNISDPNKRYHMEFVVPYSLHEDLVRVFEHIHLSSEDGELDHYFEAKEIKRNNSFVIYFKSSEKIQDLLTYMGANDTVLEYTQVKILKEIRNTVNRKNNFENANMDRTFEAAMRQTDAIEKLKRHGVFQRLSPQLKEIAQLRLDNPDMSLKQIGEQLKPPLSRSGVNHRMQTLLNKADEI